MKKMIAIALSVMLLALCFAGCQSKKDTVVVGYTIYAPKHPHKAQLLFLAHILHHIALDEVNGEGGRTGEYKGGEG